MTLETAKKLYFFYLSSGQVNKANDMKAKLDRRGYVEPEPEPEPKKVKKNGKHKKRKGSKD